MNILWTAQEIAAVTGSIVNTCAPITGISTDSRTIQTGDLYVPLKGARFDGHDYIQDAFSKGAVAALSEVMQEGPVFKVHDSLEALKNLALAARARSQARILAVTGSAGKTTTKEALGYVLSKQAQTWVTPKGYNNHWGVPISLAGLNRDDRFAVFELGMNNPGEIQPLSQMVQPHAALITAILPAHIGRMGSMEAIAAAKAEIFQGLSDDGIAIVPADEELLRPYMKNHQQITFGVSPQADYRLMEVSTYANQTEIQASLRGESIRYHLPFTSVHWPLISLGWLASIEALGGNVQQAAQDLRGFQLMAGRGVLLQRRFQDGCIWIIDDSYNANPASMKVALHRLKSYEDPSVLRRIAILGDMGELGTYAETEHERLAAHIVEMDIDLVHASGHLVRHMMEALPSEKRGYLVDSTEELATLVQSDMRSGDLYMIKGSRGGGEKPRMQCVVDVLKESTQCIMSEEGQCPNRHDASQNNKRGM